ncbi:DUF5675 family protein [Mangrovibacterium sp.]|uniref:DUF5675 family protein n=1 Tax=Mangrovibacterium sp. TaxID=1961364 RepID=UPI003561A643
MKRFLLLIIVAGLCFLVILFVSKPEMLTDVWIWLVGLSGLIVKGSQTLVAYLKDQLYYDERQENKQSETPAIPDNFVGTTLKMIRISDDGDTTLGLLFINNQFYCYTLEDSGKRVNNPTETRIPAGTYPIRLSSSTDEMTQKYKTQYPDWFSTHLQVQQVPGYPSVYIHQGGNHQHTSSGGILVSDSVQGQWKHAELTNSLLTFKRLYKFINDEMATGTAYRIMILDEHWINKLNPAS